MPDPPKYGFVLDDPASLSYPTTHQPNPTFPQYNIQQSTENFNPAPTAPYPTVNPYPPNDTPFPPPPSIYPSLEPPNLTAYQTTNIPKLNARKKKALVWMPHSAGNPFPENAVKGGRDSDGTDIFVGRAYHEGDLIPAKVIPAKDIAYVSYGGSEHMKYNYEVLCEGELTWEFANQGRVPPGAVPGGVTTNGETLFIGRVLHEGSQTVGKVHCSFGQCFIPYNGEEVGFSDYEVLVLH